MRVSFRQLDYWVRRGYIRGDGTAPGSGHTRTYTRRESLIAVVMADLVHVGFTPETAADIARDAVEECGETGEFSIALAPNVGLTITIPTL